VLPPLKLFIFYVGVLGWELVLGVEQQPLEWQLWQLIYALEVAIMPSLKQHFQIYAGN